MTSEITPPIFVVTASEVLVFRDVNAATRYMEPIDIENGEYAVVYDSIGRKFQPTVRRKPRALVSSSGVSSLVAVQSTIEPLALAATLREFLAALGHDPTALDQDQLENLVTKTVSASGFTT